MSRRPDITRYTAEALANPGRVRIINRTGPCGCGCQGNDPQHRASYDRVLQDVRVLDEPVRTRFRLVVARAKARIPGAGLVTVIGVVHIYPSGPSIFVDWYRVRA
jgi:hypothetical protein